MDELAMNRRTAMAAWAAGTALTVARPIQATAQASAPQAHNHILWYTQPASSWIEALPVGNGRISAMVHGGTDHEYLQLNEDTLWAGGPYDPANREALANLPEVRKLVFDGRYEEAEKLVQEKLMGTPIRQMSYGTIGSLIISRAGAAEAMPPARSPNDLRGEVTPAEAARPLPDYRRELDLDSAVASARWTDRGVTYRREVIASALDQVIAVRLRANRPGGIDVDLSMISPNAPGKAGAGRKDELLLTGQNKSESGIAAALRFEARVRALPHGGSIAAADGRLQVRGADELVILIAMATNYRRYDDVSGDPGAITRGQIDRAAARPFDAILQDSVADHRKLYRRVAIDLGRSASADMPTDQRVRVGDKGEDPALAALYFNYARYLLIGSSRPGGQPANLQGIWNDTNNPPWGGKYTININTQMNYWPAEPTNLPECVDPLVAMLRDVAETGARTAKTMYGARGWVCHHNSDLWRATAPIDGAQFGMWPTGGAWLCTHLWDHYDYGRDRAFLASVYPIMRGAALFFLDVLQKDPKSGFLVTNPSMSPENPHGQGSSICAGPTMDMGILRDLFDQTVKAAGILGLDASLARQFTRIRAKLAPFKIGRQGQLQEWQEDWDGDAPDPHHRHVSHLYGLYPSHQISVEKSPQLAAAARRSLEIRGDEATGWATAWRIALWARLRDGNHAHHILRFLIGPKRTYANMFDAHPPFQIDGNFGGAAAIAEMLVASDGEEILLLPALPDAWPDGSVSGLRARGACEVDVTWRQGQLTEARITSRIAGRQTVRFGKAQRVLNLRPGQTVRLSGADLKSA